MRSEERNVKTLKPCLSLLAVVVVGTLAGSRRDPREPPTFQPAFAHLWTQTGLKDVSVTHDHDKGVVTLGDGSSG
jgi:hypothetical protein